jgi:hypothetical protein
MTQDSSYELRAVRRVSWSAIILALLTFGLVLSEFPAVWFLSARMLVCVGVISGILAGLTAIAGAIYCRRKKLGFPLVTIGALVAGIITFGWAATLIYIALDMYANCHNSPLLGFGLC